MSKSFAPGSGAPEFGRTAGAGSIMVQKRRPLADDSASDNMRMTQQPNSFKPRNSVQVDSNTLNFSMKEPKTGFID
jgi:hypothetical protein